MMLEDFCEISEVPLTDAAGHYYSENMESYEDEDNLYGLFENGIWLDTPCFYDWQIFRLLID